MSRAFVAACWLSTVAGLFIALFTYRRKGWVAFTLHPSLMGTTSAAAARPCCASACVPPRSFGWLAPVVSHLLGRCRRPCSHRDGHRHSAVPHAPVIDGVPCRRPSAALPWELFRGSLPPLRSGRHPCQPRRRRQDSGPTHTALVARCCRNCHNRRAGVAGIAGAVLAAGCIWSSAAVTPRV